MERLKKSLAFGGILNPENIDRCLQHMQTITLKPEEHFLEIGGLSNRIGFIDEGIVRAYAVSPKDEDATKYFLRQNQWVVDLESYYNNTPSHHGKQAMVDTRIHAISRDKWNLLSEQVPNLYILTKSLTEATLLNKLKDNDFLHFGTATDRYQEFLKRYPDLATQVPQHYIATYLKITPQSLSRIRKKLSEE